MKIVSEITVVFPMCELPWERERKGEEAEKDRDNREDTLRAAMDAKLLWDFKFLIFFLGIFFKWDLYYDLKEKEGIQRLRSHAVSLTHVAKLHSLGVRCRTLNGHWQLNHIVCFSIN